MKYIIGLSLVALVVVFGLFLKLLCTLGISISLLFQILLPIFIIYVATGGHYTLWLAYKTIPRDFGVLLRYLRIRSDMSHALKNNITVAKTFMKHARNHPYKAAFIFEDKIWTFKEIDEYSNRIANYLLSRGLSRHQSVALFMENRPEYVATWIGCAKIGVATALVNSNLRLSPLEHSIKIVEAKAVICGAEFQNAILDIHKGIEDIPILISGLTNDGSLSHKDFVNLDVSLKEVEKTPPAEVEEGNTNDRLLYIYTSGTTGMPKAAIIKDSRYAIYATALFYLVDLGNGILYNPLPLYHTAGGLIGAGQTVMRGCTVVIRKKFSVSNFWIEATKHNCTVAQYIGEICRYLLNAQPKPEDKKHSIKVLLGNGLRPQIWEEFVNRFQIPQIAEIYGSTEGVANLINLDGKPGACGFLPVFFSKYFPGRLIRVNEETGEPLRNENGLCILCKPGECGVYLGMIKDDPSLKFYGYADKKATQKKIIKDVVEKGDSAYMSGDILQIDEFGYLYFKDRLGDTFRWRGENVSTTEVEGVVSQAANNNDAVVYGVEVAKVEGRAGMATIVDPNGNLDVDLLAKNLKKYLPNYAIPLFIRLSPDIDKTGTYKLKKRDLQKEGYNPNVISDKLYFYDGKKKTYVTLDKNFYDQIENGKVGL